MKKQASLDRELWDPASEEGSVCPQQIISSKLCLPWSLARPQGEQALSLKMSPSSSVTSVDLVETRPQKKSFSCGILPFVRKSTIHFPGSL